MITPDTVHPALENSFLSDNKDPEDKHRRAIKVLSKQREGLTDKEIKRAVDAPNKF